MKLFDDAGRYIDVNVYVNDVQSEKVDNVVDLLTHANTFVCEVV